MTGETAGYEALVCELVAAIPRGCVATYGQIAFLTGHPRRSRMVGRAVSRVPAGRRLPCHRVVNHAGRPAPGGAGPRAVGGRGGGPFKPKRGVGHTRHLWAAFPLPE